ncbi:MAG TPA: AAA family ATPase [Gemmataceae bacterium]|jgi:hypothetical protein|nr:AAA family ATPase [Gemmataceae bacterium]
MNPQLPDSSAVAIDYATTCDVADRVNRTDGNRWLWEGYLAAGNVTLLVGPWKAGKTTLLSVLLARIGSGGTLAGLAVRRARAIVVSEEGDDLWADRIKQLGFGDQLHLVSRPFRGRPTSEQWLGLIDSLVARHQQAPFDLLVIDPLASFLPSRTENHAGIMLDILLPLQDLTQLGVCVLILHHPRKAQSIEGRSARGTGALIGTMDIVLELNHLGAPSDDDRRRRLFAYSRHRATPRRRVIELTPDGTDYVSLGDCAGREFEDNWPILHGVLEDSNGKLTRKEILDQWPADFVKPSKVVLWRWLDRAIKDKLILHEGTGRRNQPFQYWLDGMEEVWKSDPFYMEDIDFSSSFDTFRKRRTLMEVLAERLNGRPAETDGPKPRRGKPRERG